MANLDQSFAVESAIDLQERHTCDTLSGALLDEIHRGRWPVILRFMIEPFISARVSSILGRHKTKIDDRISSGRHEIGHCKAFLVGDWERRVFLNTLLGFSRSRKLVDGILWIVNHVPAGSGTQVGKGALLSWAHILIWSEREYDPRCYSGGKEKY